VAECQRTPEQEHANFLRKIANEVHSLVREPENMARFRSQVRRFCEMIEVHQEEVEQLKKASDADAKLQAAIKRKERQIRAKIYGEAAADDTDKLSPPDELFEEPLEGYEDYIWYRGSCIPLPKNSDLWFYLTPPPEFHYFPSSEWTLWKSLMPSTDAERCACWYALLTAIHDSAIPERPIYTRHVYDGKWNLRDSWPEKLALKCKYDDFAAQLAGDDTPNQDTRDWIQRALDEVKADLSQNVEQGVSGTKSEWDEQQQGASGEEDFDKRLEEFRRTLRQDPSIADGWPKPSDDEMRYYLRAGLVILAQVYYKIVESVTTSPIGWVDVQLNGYYLFVVRNIKKLLGQDEFRSFPGMFKPLAHIFPSEVADLDWVDHVRPDVESFLSSAQGFLAELDFDPGQSSVIEQAVGWLSRQYEPMVRAAENYHKKAQQFLQRMMESQGQPYSHEQPSRRRPAEQNLDEIDQKIIALYQEAERQAADHPKGKLRLPGSRKIAKALHKSGVTQKEFSHTAIQKRVAKLRQMGLIGHPDDKRGLARRCTPDQLSEMGGDGRVKRKF